MSNKKKKEKKKKKKKVSVAQRRAATQVAPLHQVEGSIYSHLLVFIIIHMDF